MNKKGLFLAVLSIVFLFSGCATSPRKLSSLSLGMSKQEVISELGQPTALRGATKTETNKIIETYEYHFCKPTSEGPFCRDATYLLYFIDGKLERWGEPQDWLTIADIEGERKLKVTTDENIKIKKER